jgi:hypothetical protein
MLIFYFFYACAIPFNMARSFYYLNAFKKVVDFGKGCVPLNSETLRTTLKEIKRKGDKYIGFI